VKKMIQAVYPVLMSRNVTASLAYYARLGFVEAFRDQQDDPKYAGVFRDGVGLHLQWHDASEWDTPCDRATYRFFVPEVDALWAEFGKAGLHEGARETFDTPWGTREFHILDPDRNGLQFYRDRS